MWDFIKYSSLWEWLEIITKVVVGTAFLLFVIFMVYVSVNAEPTQKITLVKDDFTCVKSHTITRIMPVGKVMVPQYYDVCDSYERKK